jgi:TolA-binding protein
MCLAKPLFIFLGVLVFISPVRAQTQDVQQLKDQLNRLEGEIAQLNKLQGEIAQQAKQGCKEEKWSWGRKVSRLGTPKAAARRR